MTTSAASVADVMQVCRNGHVVTDLLHTHPERSRGHCDRCGAATMDRCGTCGLEIHGAVPVPGLVTMGGTRPPQFCAACGAAFPWSTGARGSVDPVSASLPLLETLLRRLPNTVRQLRSRHGNRPAFCVDDVHDVEDLLRAVLPLHFDDVRPECRTPRYALATRTDLFLATEALALVVKRTGPEIRETELASQWPEDVAYYAQRSGCCKMVGFVYDGPGLLVEPHSLETTWSRPRDEMPVQCIIAR